jgi:hypothetical protein
VANKYLATYHFHSAASYGDDDGRNAQPAKRQAAETYATARPDVGSETKSHQYLNPARLGRLAVQRFWFTHRRNSRLRRHGGRAREGPRRSRETATECPQESPSQTSQLIHCDWEQDTTFPDTAEKTPAHRSWLVRYIKTAFERHHRQSIVHDIERLLHPHLRYPNGRLFWLSWTDGRFWSLFTPSGLPHRPAQTWGHPILLPALPYSRVSPPIAHRHPTA